MEQLQITAKFPNITADNLANFKKLAGEALEIVKSKDTGTLQYDWFFSQDGKQCVVREIYASSDALMAHMGNMGDTLGELVGLGGGLEVEVYGDPSDELMAAAAAFEPAVYSYFQGT